MGVTKQTLGQGYVASVGVVLSMALVGHAVAVVDVSPVGALLAAAGLVPALGLAGANWWLGKAGLDGDQIWTVAQWAGLGIGLITLVHLAVLATGPSPEALTPVLLATAVALGAGAGVLVGSLLVLRRRVERLNRGNAVLDRVLQHNLRNDLTVVLGHLSELEDEVDGHAAEAVSDMERTVDDIVRTAEKARQIDVALDHDDRERRPMDVVPLLEERLDAVTAAYPSVTVETDLPEAAWVDADWLLKTALDNVIENVAVHADAPSLQVTVERGDDAILVRVADDSPPIPEHERLPFENVEETPLDHSTGVGLWLVGLVMEGYDGEMRYERSDGGNTVELAFPPARPEPRDGLRSRVTALRQRARGGR